MNKFRKLVGVQRRTRADSVSNISTKRSGTTNPVEHIISADGSDHQITGSGVGFTDIAPPFRLICPECQHILNHHMTFWCPDDSSGPCRRCSHLIDCAHEYDLDYEYKDLRRYLHGACYEKQTNIDAQLDWAFPKSDTYRAYMWDARQQKEAELLRASAEDAKSPTVEEPIANEAASVIEVLPPCPGPPPDRPLPDPPKFRRLSPYERLGDQETPLSLRKSSESGGFEGTPHGSAPTLSINPLHSHTNLLAFNEGPTITFDEPCAGHYNELHKLTCGHIVRTRAASKCGRNCENHMEDTTWNLPEVFACPTCVDALLNKKFDVKRERLQADLHALASQLGLSLETPKMRRLAEQQRPGEQELEWANERKADRQALLDCGRSCEAVSDCPSLLSPGSFVGNHPSLKFFRHPGHRLGVKVESQGHKFQLLAVQQSKALRREGDGDSVQNGIPIISYSALRFGRICGQATGHINAANKGFKP